MVAVFNTTLLRGALLRFYEAVIVLKTNVPEEEQKRFFKQARDIIQQFSGSLHHIDWLGSRPLASLGKNKNIRRGLFFQLSYKSLTGAVFEVERLLRITEYVLFFHHEKLDSRVSLDQHQKNFEKLLQESKEREEERQARIQIKRNKYQQQESAKV